MGAGGKIGAGGRGAGGKLVGADCWGGVPTECPWRVPADLVRLLS